MTWPSQLRTWFRSIFGRDRVERDMEAELRFHLDAYADDLVRQGMSREEALRRARLEFGTVESRKEECRASLGLRLWDELHSDFRYTMRVLRKSPGFSAVAILTLALGIGANTAIFTLVDALLLRLAPVHHPEQLYEVMLQRPGSIQFAGTFTNPLWDSIRERQDVFSGMAAFSSTDFDLAKGGAVKRAQGLWVNGDFFATLGVRPALGRLISSADDFRGCPAVAVLSYSFWRDHYGASPAVIGSTLSLNLHAFEIIGVAAPGFSGLNVGMRFDVAAPICATALLDGARSRLDVRSWWWLTLVGRIKAELSPEQVKARLAAISPAVMQATIPQNWDADSQKIYQRNVLSSQPAGTGISFFLRQQYREPLQILMAVVTMVLLIACANVAALLLARSAAQNRELAVRLALGASRARLARQLLMHALVLSLAGAVAGALMAQWGTTLLVRSFSTRRLPLFFDLSPDWRIVAFTAAIALVTAVVFGMLPAMRSAQIPVTDAMRTSATSQTDRRTPLRRWIVSAQIALSLVLLVTAGLFLRSFVKLVDLDPGFDKHNVLLVTADLKPTSIKADRQFDTFEALEARFRTLPGAVVVGRSHLIPLSGGSWDNYITPDTPNPPKGKDSVALMNFISPGYFGAMRMSLLAGRNVLASDTKTSGLVVVVNQAFVRRFYPHLSPLGHVMRIPDDAMQPGPPIQIVGVVADSKYLTLREPMEPTAFFPLSQIPEPASDNTYAIRSATRPENLIPDVEKAAASVSSEIPLQFNTVAQEVDDAIVQERLLAMLSGFFGFLAVLLAMIGLYGTVSYQVTLRRPEFGIRVALGARFGSIVRLVFAEVATVLVVGVAAGIVIALLAASALGKLLFGLGPRDPATIAGAALLLALMALAAAYAPARRAARVDPMISLRSE